MSDQEQIDQLAESGELIDHGAAAFRRGDREAAWLYFREAELRMQLAGMRNMRDIAAVNVPLQERMNEILRDDPDKLI